MTNREQHRWCVFGGGQCFGVGVFAYVQDHSAEGIHGIKFVLNTSLTWDYQLLFTARLACKVWDFVKRC